ncbi:MAG: cytochrome c-type biogenesis protein [Hyphomicrobiaceae bacterium]
MTMSSLPRRLARFLCLAAMVAVTWPTGHARAVTPDEMLADPGLEMRARAISQKLRCVVCQNQSIDDSTAPLARDLRVLVRDRLQGGDSDEQTLVFIVARYGNFVLLQPPLQVNTLLLWLGPALLLLLGATCFGVYLLRARRRLTETEEQHLQLSAADRMRLDAILTEGQIP